jgi:hypothetical protein
MNPLIHRTQIASLFLITLALGLVALSPTGHAQLPPPPPDGGYPGNNTAEGTGALQSLKTGQDNTANGWDALFTNTTGNQNTATGAFALVKNTASDNTATGYQALAFNATGSNNTANGANALGHNMTGAANTATGFNTLSSNTTGGSNTAEGFQALLNTTGSNNIAVGASAGANLTTGSNNIDIGNAGVASEANTIRIGKQGTQKSTIIAGISGEPVTGSTVVVNSTGKVGVATSSARFKEAIKPMDKASEAILALKPVTFRYKEEVDPEKAPQFGLVAEEVEKVNPSLVVHDEEGKPFTVRYEAVNAMLLNEFLKARRQIDAQQKEIEALTAGLQKVSAQLKLNQPAPQTVVNP